MTMIYQEVPCECCKGRGTVGKFVEQDAKPRGDSKFAALTREQQRHCEFMGFDPDNPDVPLD